MPADAELSVAVIAGDLRERADICLRHILSQSALERMEILLLDLNPEAGELASASHPGVRVLPGPGLRYYCEAQAELVRAARAPLIAFVEDHTYVQPGWAEAVIRGFDSPRVSVVNYAFTVVHDGYMSRSILLAEYGPWMAPHPGGPISHAASNNVAYRRDALLPHIEGNDAAFETEFLSHRAIRRGGGIIRLVPAALAAHESWCSLAEACLANGAQKRVIGARRSVLWSRTRRILWSAAMSVAPPLFLMRLAWSLRLRPRLWTTLVAALPVLLAIYACCAWNEALGYLFGAGTSREDFRDRELAVRRNG